MSTTFTELVAARNDIDTSDPLNMFEAYQSIFVANLTRLRVADFASVSLTHTTLATQHARGDILTQATSNAQGIVDYTDTTKTHTFVRVTSGTFDTTNQVTGSGSGTAFTPTAVTNPPTWHTWTAYPDGNSGTITTKATLGCNFRGRCVLAGDPDHPYEWYMSRQANPYDWDYTQDDAQAAVAGTNSDAGELGDIIRALVPYKDEYLVFGCANSVWVLRGDPASGGQLTAVDLTKGFLGADSWCYDGVGNLYFCSTSGFHCIPAGLGPIQNISAVVWPGIMKNADPNLYRTTLTYDRDREGIVIDVTLLSDGTNDNIFYDLRTGGFFPENSVAACGVYSALYYDSPDATTRGVLLGCTDGFIRSFDESTQHDVGTATNSAITSSVTLPLVESDSDRQKIKSTITEITTAGGSSGGAESDTSGVTLQIFKGNNAEDVIEAIADGDTPSATFAITGPGRTQQIRSRVTGHTIGLRFYNNTIDTTWALEKVALNAKVVGKE